MKEAGEFPRIYHRKTPEKLPEHFMVQAEKDLLGSRWYLPSM